MEGSAAPTEFLHAASATASEKEVLIARERSPRTPQATSKCEVICATLTLGAWHTGVQVCPSLQAKISRCLQLRKPLGHRKVGRCPWPILIPLLLGKLNIR